MMAYAIPVRKGALALAALAALSAGAFSVAANDAALKPEANAVSDGVRVDACANDTNLLGLSRIVEIDTTGGPQFGGGHGQGTDFLKDGEVILTFDDGPLRPYTRPVLKALAAHCTKATFFMVGKMAAADPALVKEVAQAGHTISSHTWSHQNLRPIGLMKGRNEFEMGLTAVNKALGQKAAPFFRFPYLSENRSVMDHLKSRNVAALWVDIDSKDYLTRDAKSVHRRVMSELASKRKGIILMHDIQPSTAGAIKGLLDEMHAKGFKVVHVVPKTSIDTIAAYDGEVEKTFAAKSAASAAQPLANRSVVWSMSPTAAGAAKVAPSAGGKAAARKAAAVEDELPWLKAAAKPAAAYPKSKAAARPAANASSESLPWQPKLFGY